MKPTIIESEVLMEDIHVIIKDFPDDPWLSKTPGEIVSIDGIAVFSILDHGRTYVSPEGIGAFLDLCPWRLKSLERDRFHVTEVRIFKKEFDDGFTWMWKVVYNTIEPEQE